MSKQSCMFGLAAEFEDAESLLDAAEKARAEGYEVIQAYTPYHVEGLSEIIDKDARSNMLAWLVFGGLIVGALFGFALQYYASVEGYAINVGGRPLNSWPSFIQVTFELAILFAALAVVGGYFLRMGLPLPYHPIFNTPNIELASSNRFFLCIEVKDRRFHLQQTRTFLEDLGPVTVSEVQC